MSPTALVEFLSSGGSLADVNRSSLHSATETARRLAARLLDELGEVLVIEDRPLVEVLRGPLVMRPRRAQLALLSGSAS